MKPLVTCSQSPLTFLQSTIKFYKQTSACAGWLTKFAAECFYISIISYNANISSSLASSLQRDYWLSRNVKRCLKSGQIGPIYWLKVIWWCRNVRNAQDCVECAAVQWVMLPVRKHYEENNNYWLRGSHQTNQGEVGLEDRHLSLVSTGTIV